MSREAAYAAVQRNAMAVWDAAETDKGTDEGGSFLDRLNADPVVSGALSGAELAALFDPAYHTRHVDEIFDRVFGKKKQPSA